MVKCFWVGNLFIEIQANTELYWIDRKQGGRLYMLFNIGLYTMSHINDGCKALSITLPFFGIKVGKAK